VDATISTRYCEIRLGISEIENEEAYDIIRLCDTDYVGDLDQQRSKTGYVFMVVEYVIS